MPSEMTFRTAFGSWSNALKAASFKPVKVIPIGARRGIKNKKGVARIKTIHGYIHIFKPEHPLAMKNGYVREHRMIVYDAGILKDPNHEIHHKNGDKTDNRLENLEVLPKEKHSSITWKGVKRILSGSPCKICGEKTLSKYILCNKHYKSEWDRVNRYENPELLEGKEKI